MPKYVTPNPRQSAYIKKQRDGQKQSRDAQQWDRDVVGRQMMADMLKDERLANDYANFNLSDYIESKGPADA